MNKSLPDFFVIGAAKSATTSLYNYFKQSNSIEISKQKEPSFLVYRGENKFIISSINKVRTSQGFSKNIDEYEKNFCKNNNNSLIGDFSTHYLYFADIFIKSVSDWVFLGRNMINLLV